MKRKSSNQAWRAVVERRRWTSRDAEAVLSAWRESGVSVSAFARQQGLEVERLLRWRRQVGSAAVQFHPVALVSGSRRRPSNHDGGVELVLRGGRRVAVQAGFDGALLEELVRVVEGWSC
jgi:hypothetical protein